MLVIGLTGGIGSGKTTVAKLFAELGITLVDTDMLAREVVEPGQPALDSIVQHFGEQFINDNGVLNRELLRVEIFSNPKERQWLEALLHPLIEELVATRIDQCTSPYCILVSPLLLETEQYKLAQRILIVDVCEKIQIERTLQRDQSNRSTIESIINSQIGRQDRLSKADDIIDNEQAPVVVKERVAFLHKKYSKMAQSEDKRT